MMINSDIAAMQYVEADARTFEIEALIANMALIVALLLYSLEAINWIFMAIVISVAITRWMICVHELFHIVNGEKVNPLVRLILIPFTPLFVGYEEFRVLHMGHHRYNAEPEDPEAYHIRGGHFATLVQAFTFPERSTYNYLKTHGWSTVKLSEFALRFAFFIGLLMIFKVNFLIFWAVLRLFYAVNIWVFFHCLHVKGGEYGVYPIRLPEWLGRAYGVIYGRHSLQATLHHDVHHKWPKVAHWNLAKLSEAAPELPGSVNPT